MRIIEQAAVGVRWTMLGKVGSQILNFFVVAILARELGPVAFGLVALASLWTQFMELFQSQGLGMAIVQRKDLQPKHLDSAFWLVMLMSVLITALTFSLAPFIANFFKEPELNSVIKTLSLSFLLGGLSSVQSAVMTRERKFKQLAARDLVGTLIGSIVALTMAFSGAGVWSLVVQKLVASSSKVAMLWFTSSWRPSFLISLQHLKDLWAFSISVLCRNLVAFFCLGFDKVIVSVVLGSGQLGYYSNSRKLAGMLSGITRSPIETVALPLMSEFQKDGDKMTETIYKVQKLKAVMLVPIFCGLAALAPETVDILFGLDWKEAKTPLRYLALAQAVNTLSAVAFTAFLAIGRPGLSLLHFSISGVTSIIAAAIGSQWGINGVAFAMFLSSFIYSISFVFILCKVTSATFIEYIKLNLPASISGITMAICVILLNGAIRPYTDFHLRAACGIAIGATVYILLIRLLSKDSFDMTRYVIIKALGIKK